mmetsp:Transcript_32720/g.52206  ORF Transcript_32720/g.52206 Transcript_32720/m.52206 type:complete len:123 (-) Transcript_32720:12-380(-)|eukprot:CAMPEP_0169138406 /NCGR_PEP_ID=MMETSP1015-20121227/42224_1 /TAXON_ID=342587 /ORGANISM="Karlodinium micrum, Strain CCMP2283" /LENGTH=122 /DNA_ID=CAMNT_0009203653 /DNA_START=81 /DNA_END=449 /DNA_ORIENTATION=+
MLAEVLGFYIFEAVKAMNPELAGSFLTTTGSAEFLTISTEVVLFISGLLAGWLVFTWQSKVLREQRVSEKMSVRLDETDETADEEDWTHAGMPSTAGHKITAGLALLEQYGVFGAAPGSWNA